MDRTELFRPACFGLMPEANSRVGCSPVNLTTIFSTQHRGQRQEAVDSRVCGEDRWRASKPFLQLQVLGLQALLCADLSVACRLWSSTSPAMTVILVGVELTVMIILIVIITIIIVVVIVVIVVQL